MSSEFRGNMIWDRASTRKDLMRNSTTAGKHVFYFKKKRNLRYVSITNLIQDGSAKKESWKTTKKQRKTNIFLRQSGLASIVAKHNQCIYSLEP